MQISRISKISGSGDESKGSILLGPVVRVETQVSPRGESMERKCRFMWFLSTCCSVSHLTVALAIHAKSPKSTYSGYQRKPGCVRVAQFASYTERILGVMNLISDLINVVRIAGDSQRPLWAVELD